MKITAQCEWHSTLLSFYLLTRYLIQIIQFHLQVLYYTPVGAEQGNADTQDDQDQE